MTALVHQGATTHGAALAVSGASIVDVQVVRRRSIVNSVLARRWMTWAILAPLWLLAATWVPGRVAVLTVFAIVAAREFGKLNPPMVLADRWILIGWAAVSVPAFALGLEPLAILAAAACSAIVVPLWVQDVEAGPGRIGAVTLGLLLVVAPFLALSAISSDVSAAAFFTVGLAVAFSDVAAFMIGSAFGRRRMSPRLSPNKRLEGVLGNVVGACVGVGVAVAVGIVEPRLWWMAPLVALGSVTGDLTVSLLKRHRGVKDAGSWLPGFGGLLDRVDSLLVSALLVYVALTMVGGVS